MATKQTYTDPELRAKLKDQIQQGDKGGKVGQWSARKAQLLVAEYGKAGGGYTGPKKATQKHLEQWGEQDWDTDGKNGVRYLPATAWKLLSKAEREATDTKKKKTDGQFVANTEAAKEARKAATIVTLSAPDARKAVAKMTGASLLKRARTAEKAHGKARKSVLTAIEDRRQELKG